MRNAKLLLGILVVLCCSGFSLGQMAAPPPAKTPGDAVNAILTIVEHEFTGAADAMPEDKYSYAPTGNGECKGVRTVAQQVKHVAAVNYVFGSTILQEKPPVDTGGESGPDAIKSKAEIVKFLKDSFAYVHKAVPDISEKGALEAVKNPFGERPVTRLELAAWIPSHSFDHYGQMVEYLRMNGI